MKNISLPQARIPLAWGTYQGVRIPVEIDMEWMRAFLALVDRSGGDSGSSSFENYLPQFFDTPHTDNLATEAMRCVDELRNELAATRSSLNELRTMLDEHTAQLEIRPMADFRNRLEQIEDRLQ